MADRFWVGGSGTWGATNTTNWSASSGGAGGASAPTSADDVYFDANSDVGSAFTVTLGTGAVNKNVSVSGLDQTMTLAGSANWAVHGNLYFAPGSLINNTHGGSMNFNGVDGVTNTITTNGITLIPSTAFNIRININSGKWVLESSLTTGISGYQGGVYVYGGIFDTAGYTINAVAMVITGGIAKEIYLRASTVYVASYFINSATGSLILDAGTSTVTVTDGNEVSSNTPITLYDVVIRKTLTTAIGNITVNNLTFSVPYPYDGPVSLRNQVVVLNTMTIQSELTFISDVLGVQRTLNVKNISFLGSGIARPILFRDINFTGDAAPLSRVNLGDAGNNLGINFPAPKTVYCVSDFLIPPYNFVGSVGKWATTSGGVATEYIFPQDTGIIDNASPSAISWPYSMAYIFGNLDAESRTTPVTLTFNNSGASQNHIYATFNGDFKVSSAVTLVTHAGDSNIGQVLSFQGHKDQVIKLAGQQVNSIWVNKYNSALILDSDLSIFPTKALSVDAGTLKTNSHSVTCGRLLSNTSYVRALDLGTSNVTLTGTGTVWNATATNLTVTGSGILNLTGSAAKTFTGGGANYGSVILNQAGAGDLTISGSNTFGGIANTYRPSVIKLTANTTQTVNKLLLNGVVGSEVTLQSTTAGTRATLSKPAGSLAVYGCLIKDIAATGGATWKAPSNYANVNQGNNTGWDFSPINKQQDNHWMFIGDPIVIKGIV